MKKMLLWLIATVCLLCAACHPHFVQRGHCAESPVTVIIPFGPGGAVDMAAQILADYWKMHYGQETLIVHIPGGAGTPAMHALQKAPADGNTMLFFSAYTYAATAQISPSGSSLYDLTPIGQCTILWLALGVHRLSPVQTVDQFFQMVRSREGRLVYGTHGALSPQRLFMLNLIRRNMPDLENMLQHVSLGSGFEVAQAMLSGRIYAGFAVPANFRGGVTGGDFRLLAVSSPERLPEYPEVPTFAEQYGSDFVQGSPHGLVVRVGSPVERVAELRHRLAAAMSDPSVRFRFDVAGIPPVYEDAEGFQRTLERIWTDIATLIHSGKL